MIVFRTPEESVVDSRCKSWLADRKDSGEDDRVP